MLASALLAIWSDELNDNTPDGVGTRWPWATRGLRYLNDAQRAVVLARPDANAVTAAVQLTASTTKQSLPTGGLRLLDVTRNMGSNGTTPGAAISMADREAQDEYSPDWHAGTAGSAVTELYYDYKRNPLVYYVSPKIQATPAVYIEITYSKTPDDVATVGASISLADIYGPALIEWMLYRAYLVNITSAASVSRAQLHLQTFATLLGVKLQAEQRTAPEGAS